ncbi:MAG: hypothetical protein OXE44_01075 [Nitrospinae bacterium]|nr:hypothetical protein [Nitrospinota bacterium]
MFFRKNTSMNKLSALALTALLALGPAGCGGGGGGGAPPAVMPQPTHFERSAIDLQSHPNGAGDVASLAWENVYLPTRPGVRQRLLLARASNAGTKAVILFPGGNGTPISYDEGASLRFVDNFLVRSSPLFANEGFITAVVESPSDRPEGPQGGRDGGMTDAFRQSSMHLTDIRAAVDFLVSEGAREIYLIGTSRGTLSVAYLAAVMTHANVAGYVLTASLAESPPAVRSYARRITDPVLMAHHTGDVCRVTMYSDARDIYDSIPASTRKDFISVSGGSPPIDTNPCRALAAHGFLGKERETVAGIVEWMNTGTVTETNLLTDDDAPAPHEAWLARFGRAAAEHVTEAIGDRMRGAPSTRVTLGGQDIDLAGSPLPLADADSGIRLTEGLLDERSGENALSREISMSELLLASSFHLASADGTDTGGGWSFWGGAARSGFDAKEGALALDGDVTTATLGFDFERERWLAGVALSRSAGDGGFKMGGACASDCSGDLESTLTGVYPYARYRFGDRLSAWGILGHGRGDLALGATGRSSVETDIEMNMAAIGGRGVLLPASKEGGIELALRSDALMTWTSSDETQSLAEAEVETSRLRLALEASREIGLASGARLTPSFEVGLRYDGGDAETGGGVEVGGGLRYAGSGFAVQVNARGLLAHADGDYEEWGVSGSVRFAPGEGGRGLSMRLGSSWGAPAGGAEQLWAGRSASGLIGSGQFDPGARLDAEVGYGLDGMGGLLTPYGGASVSETAQSYRVGGRFRLHERLSMSLEGERREGVDDVDHGLALRGSLRW